MKTSRRQFLALAMGGLGSATVVARAEQPKAVVRRSDLVRQVGITTSTIDAHVSAGGGDGKIALVDLPKLMRDELDMHIIDLNTRTLGSLEPAHVERFRAAVDKAGSEVINLKLNQPGLDLGSSEADVRNRTMMAFRQCVDAAALLGARWVRPLPRSRPAVMEHLIAGYQELVAYAEPKKVGLLVENFGWLESDPKAAVRLIRQIDAGVFASPDTGNWANDEVRYAGLKEMFPLAVTCDFKAGKLGPNGDHPAYDLRRCFQVGWDSGFRGPWCIEHPHRDRQQLMREMALLRDMLRRWMDEQTQL